MVEKQFGIEILPTWHGTPAGNPAKFTAEVRAELQRILHSKAGQALASSLRFHGKTVLLMPYEGQDCNAQEDGVTPGSDRSVVLFTPGILRASPCSKNKSSQNNATLPHEILFHELVHAFRRTSKHFHPRKVTGRLAAYTHTEEFLAILVTNIFIADASNAHKTGLRASHQGHGALEKELAHSFRFYRNGTRAFNIIAGFCEENRGFSGLLSHIRGPFNPIAAYYGNRRKAFDMAAEGDADAVFESLIPMDYYQEPSGTWTRIGPFPEPKAGGS